MLLERRLQQELSICKVVLVIKKGRKAPVLLLVPPFDIQRYLTRYIIVIVVKEHKRIHIDMFVL